MYEAISGRAPFADREENVAKIYAHLQDEPPWLPGDADGAARRGDRPRPRQGAAATATPPPATSLAPRPPRSRATRSCARPSAASRPARPRPRPGSPTCRRSTTRSRPRPERTVEAPPRPPGRRAAAADRGDGRARADRAARLADGREPTAAVAATRPADDAPTRRRRRGRGLRTAAASGPRWGRIAAALAAVAAVVVAAVLGWAGEGTTGPTTYDAAEGGRASRSRCSAMPVGIDGRRRAPSAVATRDGQAVAAARREDRTKPTGESVSCPTTARTSTFADGSRVGDRPEGDRSSRPPIDGSEAETIAVDVATSRSASPPTATGSVWAAEPGDTSISHDRSPATRSVSAIPVEAGDARPSVAAGDGALWVVDRDAGQVFRVDPTDPSTAQSFDVGRQPEGRRRRRDGSVWVANTDDGNGRPARRRDGRPAGADRRRRRAAADGLRLRPGLGRRRRWLRRRRSIPATTTRPEGRESQGSPEGVAIGTDQVWVPPDTAARSSGIDPGAAEMRN